MNSLNLTPNPNPSPSELAGLLKRLGLHALPAQIDGLLERARQGRWDAAGVIAQLARIEEDDRSRRGLERRLTNARLGRFKPMADFDWNWPKKIDRPLIERAFTLDFIPEGRNLILLGANGLGKTMIAKNLCFQAVQAGYTALFRTASELLDDLQSDSPELVRRRLKKYARPSVLCIDELGYLSYDHHAADLLYEVVSRRYEHRSLIVSTNRAFRDWSAVFPNAACITTLVDRLTHHVDLILIEGKSYRLHESEQEAAARRKQRP